MPKNTSARTEPCLTPLHVEKVLDMAPSNWALAFMFSWNATRMESSASGSPTVGVYYTSRAHLIEGFGQA